MIKTMQPSNVLRLGMLSFVLAQILPRILHRGFGVGDDWTDALMGFFMGTAIALMILSMWMSPKSACRAKS